MRVYLRSGEVGMKSNVRVFALTFSPVPSIQTYITCTFPLGIGRLRYRFMSVLSKAALGECSNVGFDMVVSAKR